MNVLYFWKSKKIQSYPYGMQSAHREVQDLIISFVSMQKSGLYSTICLFLLKCLDNRLSFKFSGSHILLTSETRHSQSNPEEQPAVASLILSEFLVYIFAFLCGTNKHFQRCVLLYSAKNINFFDNGDFLKEQKKFQPLSGYTDM